MDTISRRAYLRMSGAAALAAPFGMLSQTELAFAADAITVRDGVQRGAIGCIKAALVDVQSKYGIKHDLRTFNDATSVILALGQRELDFGNVTAQHVVRAIEQDIPLAVVCGFGGGYNLLVAHKDLKLKTGDTKAFQALTMSRKAANKRLKIGTPTGSQQHLKLISYLKAAGINPDQDVEIVNVPFPAQPRALDDRQVDLIMSLASFGSMTIVRGFGVPLFHIYGDEYGRWEIGFATRRDLVEKSQDVVQKFVNSYVGAMKTFLGNMPKRLELERRVSKFPPAVIKMEQSFLKLSYKVTIEDIKRTAKEMHRVGWTKKDLSDRVEGVVDYRFLEKATGMMKKELQGF